MNSPRTQMRSALRLLASGTRVRLKNNFDNPRILISLGSILIAIAIMTNQFLGETRVLLINGRMHWPVLCLALQLVFSSRGLCLKKHRGGVLSCLDRVVGLIMPRLRTLAMGSDLLPRSVRDLLLSLTKNTNRLLSIYLGLSLLFDRAHSRCRVSIFPVQGRTGIAPKMTQYSGQPHLGRVATRTGYRSACNVASESDNFTDVLLDS